ncbi:HepT-like ribonuclease domain-containing protein [Gloeocapsopsis sp. IPPAS B-1203]|uniref:HepT-like ribonuclease domain-containing protein n=1 Tax=Gloeocapsopsis sp. IPPAS B-1203 TaxID=2049454 RepID=UPI0025A0A557|nr:HepT-like ribonuclease domain-containing protein [Gloeocapsopsis sp. IPPAS B-1203]
MQASNRDAAALWDMISAVRRIQEFTANLSFENYQESLLIQSAVERQLEILGEAAGRVSEAFRCTHSEIDWRRIVGLRNILIHRYDEIQQDIL